MVLILRFRDEEHIIGRGQLRNISVNITPDDLDITAFGDLSRTFLRSNRTHVTIDLEIERDPS